MNDKLWKIIQYSSIVLAAAIITIMILIADFEPKPGGGWQGTFPNKIVQNIALVLFIPLIPTFAFSTYVRREKEVSFRVALRTIVSMIVWISFSLFVGYIF